mgnify:CR=1 FL=1
MDKQNIKDIPLLDAAAFLLETVESPKHVGMLQVFKAPAGKREQTVKRIIEQYRASEVAEPFNFAPVIRKRAMPKWAKCNSLDMDYHVRRAALPQPGTQAELLALWREDRGRDRERGFTQRGPHVDDLKLSLHDRPAKAYASQGQQRAMVLAMKIAEIETLEADHGRSPVLLLDDVSSELDPERNARLFEFLNRYEGQAFVTTTDRSFLRIDAPARVWTVRCGGVEQMES